MDKEVDYVNEVKLFFSWFLLISNDEQCLPLVYYFFEFRLR